MALDDTMLARQFQTNNNSRPTFLFPFLAGVVASLACYMIVGTDRLRSSGCFDMRSETICVLLFTFQTNDDSTTNSYGKDIVLTSVDKMQQVSSRRNRTIDVPEDHVDVASFSLERMHQTRGRRRQQQQQQRPKQDKEEDIVGITPPLLNSYSQRIEKWSNEEENGERGDTTTLLELERQQRQRQQQRQRRQSFVKKTVYSDTVRFLFIASQDGTGHHGWHQALAWNHVCQQPNGTTFDSMSRVYFRSSNELTMNAEQLRHDLRANVVQEEQQQRQQRDSGHTVEPTMFCLNTLTSPMMSYPNGRGHIDKHPDINLLAQIAEDAGVDLRIITLHRPPANIVVSCSVHRNFGTPYREALLQIDQTAFLISQLESIDPAFYTCTATSEVVETATHIQDHVFGGMTGKMATVLMPAINKTFVDRTDNQTKARIEIKDKLHDMMMTTTTTTTTTTIDRDSERRDDTDDEGASVVAVAAVAAGSIDRLLDELDTSYLYFRNVVCANKR